MGNRRHDRELVMQFLFSIDINKLPADKTIKDFALHFANSKISPFFLRLISGISDTYAEIDSLIEKASKNWSMERMSGIDRNLLRIGVYELLYCEDIPASVSINEAIDIGKRFGTVESGAFINGILDKINKELQKKNKEIGGNFDN